MVVGIYVFLRRKRNWSYDLHALGTHQMAYTRAEEIHEAIRIYGRKVLVSVTLTLYSH